MSVRNRSGGASAAAAEVGRSVRMWLKLTSSTCSAPLRCRTEAARKSGARSSSLLREAFSTRSDGSVSTPARLVISLRLTSSITTRVKLASEMGCTAVDKSAGASREVRPLRESCSIRAWHATLLPPPCRGLASGWCKHGSTCSCRSAQSSVSLRPQIGRNTHTPFLAHTTFLPLPLLLLLLLLPLLTDRRGTYTFAAAACADRAAAGTSVLLLARASFCSASSRGARHDVDVYARASAFPRAAAQPSHAAVGTSTASIVIGITDGRTVAVVGVRGRTRSASLQPARG
ncbi:hypothetical protein DQ04_14981000 [Trypanosoma grayi]|uniref:hypothetical protein n=1 Tax=Trypanosoma grayi TaxID=71804 RepID=UPI0004F4208C|nr:hypothetical protein DQ04_14981000 [Trypanosoma grayi]KEG06256.1 hypothetical protein DQ04_14981000 [Trypanosoma grayi]